MNDSFANRNFSVRTLGAITFHQAKVILAIIFEYSDIHRKAPF